MDRVATQSYHKVLKRYIVLFVFEFIETAINQFTSNNSNVR